MNVKEIETAISELPPAQVAELADWFDAYRAQLGEGSVALNMKLLSTTTPPTTKQETSDSRSRTPKY